MKAADLNRIKKCRNYIKNIQMLLDGIKWESVSTVEWDLVGKAHDSAQELGWRLGDIETIAGNQ